MAKRIPRRALINYGSDPILNTRQSSSKDAGADTFLSEEFHGITQWEKVAGACHADITGTRHHDLKQIGTTRLDMVGLLDC